MTFYEMVGCLWSIIGLCAGIGTGVILGFGLLGGILGGVIGYFLGWYIGLGIAELIVHYWEYRNRKSGKSSKDDVI